ncbi:hypothetical protein SAMN05216338_101557 [Bradyrhizobium sp. Rc2d]|nr:hypothetical protein SAMN05216338_101557 [Bradyrhizobium sp. Rc2d]
MLAFYLPIIIFGAILEGISKPRASASTQEPPSVD